MSEEDEAKRKRDQQLEELKQINKMLIKGNKELAENVERLNDKFKKLDDTFKKAQRRNSKVDKA